MKRRNINGFSMAEILVGLFVLSMIIIPVNRMMRASVKTKQVSDNIFAATNSASSLMETIEQIPEEQFIEVSRSEIFSLTGNFNGEKLGITEDKLFKRYLTIKEGSNAGDSKVFHLIVEIEEIKKKSIIYKMVSSKIIKEKKI